MVKNIISYILPFGGLAVLFLSFHYLDKYASSPENDPVETENTLE